MATRKYETGDTPDEVWWDIPSFPGYQFSSDQRVRSFWSTTGEISPDRWKIRKMRYQGIYPAYAFKRDGKYHIVTVHRIVAMIAYGEIPDGLFVLHGDDDKTNCFPSNLTFGTKKDNVQDAFRNGGRKPRTNKATGRRRSKTNEASVSEIRKLYKAGARAVVLAKKFGLGESTIYQILSGKTWQNVA